jgi:hypothetical protein
MSRSWKGTEKKPLGESPEALAIALGNRNRAKSVSSPLEDDEVITQKEARALAKKIENSKSRKEAEAVLKAIEKHTDDIELESRHSLGRQIWEFGVNWGNVKWKDKEGLIQMATKKAKNLLYKTPVAKYKDADIAKLYHSRERSEDAENEGGEE